MHLDDSSSKAEKSNQAIPTDPHKHSGETNAEHNHPLGIQEKGDTHTQIGDNSHFGDTPTDPSAKMMADVMSMLKANATKSPGAELTNHGQIDRMNIPSGWQGGPDSLNLGSKDNEMHHSSYMEYHPANAPDAQLGFYYRGQRTSEAAGKHFQDVLSKPAHELSKAELGSLSEIIGDKANSNDFSTSSAKTEDINGKRVLVLEGKYTASQQQSKHIYVDSDNTGTAVQEIFFQAPADKYKAYEKKANSAIDSIRWTC